MFLQIIVSGSITGGQRNKYKIQYIRTTTNREIINYRFTETKVGRVEKSKGPSVTGGLLTFSVDAVTKRTRHKLCLIIKCIRQVQ